MSNSILNVQVQFINSHKSQTIIFVINTDIRSTGNI